MKRILIVGVTSAIAEATARLFASRGDRLYLLARNGERLQSIAQDLGIRGAKSVQFDVLDMNDFGRHAEVLDRAVSHLGAIDVVLIAHGTLPDQKACEKDVALMLREMETNAMSTVSLLTLLANYFEKQRTGTIAVITSVAGDRGRQSNYVYGAAKGMVSIFLQGLRNRLHSSGVGVVTIKPGFVDTPMTGAFEKGVLWAKPEQVAKGIVKAIDLNCNEAYLPGFWKWIMVVIKVFPESIFKRLSL